MRGASGGPSGRTPGRRNSPGRDEWRPYAPVVGRGAIHRARHAPLAQRLPAPLALDPHDAAQAWVRVVSCRDGQALLLDAVEEGDAGPSRLLGVGVVRR